MAELRLLTARQLRQVYRERVRSDFPPSERRPLASMERLRAAGAKRVKLTAPADVAVQTMMLPKCTGVTATYGGLEDD